MSMNVSIRIYTNIKNKKEFKMTIKFDYPYKTRSDYLETLVKALVRRRKQLGITQEELNHKLGMADRLVSKWEVGTRTPLTFHLYCWADALKSELTIIPYPLEAPPSATLRKMQATNDNLSNDVRAINDNELIVPKKKFSA